MTWVLRSSSNCKQRLHKQRHLDLRQAIFADQDNATEVKASAALDKIDEFCAVADQRRRPRAHRRPARRRRVSPSLRNAVKSKFSEVVDVGRQQKCGEQGGLAVLGTERHESVRIDNQLRGRSGRQGDAGASVYAISLEDKMFNVFGSDKMGQLSFAFEIAGDDGEPLQSRYVDQITIDDPGEEVESYYPGDADESREVRSACGCPKTYLLRERRQEVLTGDRAVPIQIVRTVRRGHGARHVGERHSAYSRRTLVTTKRTRPTSSAPRCCKGCIPLVRGRDRHGVWLGFGGLAPPTVAPDIFTVEDSLVSGTQKGALTCK